MPTVKLPDTRLIRLRVLVVDDSRYMRQLLKAMLLGIGVGHVIEAKDGAAALALMQGQRLDLVLVDMEMAPVDGVEFCCRLRSDRDSPNPLLPVLMLTGHTEAARIRRARDAGVDDVLAKPVSLNALYDRLIGVFRNPRPFVTAARYAGPDRRRIRARYRGEERRGRPPSSRPRAEE
jgi:CheY-like chemotaxis protein